MNFCLRPDRAQSAAKGQAPCFAEPLQPREEKMSTVIDLLPDNRGVELHAYMDFRAARENVDHTFTPAMYAEMMREGVVQFFGIDVDPDTGAIISDDQNPGALAAYRSN